VTAVDDRPVLIIGGAGFIGSNLAHSLARDGARVMLFDDLSRKGVEENVTWLRGEHGSRVELQVADVRNRPAVREAVASARAVFHMAAQVAVTTSLDDPRADFDVNASGTLEVLEAIRACASPPPLVFTSTNKVYGCLETVPLRCDDTRWSPVDSVLEARGIDESRPLDFRTPYGCSKGAADQYVLDYARSFGLRAVVFRMSCIYGPHQRGTEDQGWVAHFLLRALAGEPITIFGDGKQVRDVLFVDDLVQAFRLAWRDIDSLAGRAFNIGGGAANTLSLLELVQLVQRLIGKSPELAFEGWRTGDQRYYVSDTTAFTRATGWRAQIGPRTGVEALHGWLTTRAHKGEAHAQ
jgi:CDP-paratose 2-epimerase